MSTPRTASSQIAENPSPVPAAPRQSWRAAAIITVLALAALGGSYAVSERLAGSAATPLPNEQTSTDEQLLPNEQTSPSEQTSLGVHESEEDVFRLLGEVRDLKMTLQTLRQDLDRTADSLSGQQNQAQVQIERTDRLSQDTAISLARVAAQVDQVERRMAHTVAAVRPATLPADGPTVTGSIRAPKKAQPRKEEYVEGWVLREVNDQGLALVESQTAGLFGVRVGNTVPGVGRVEKVERRGSNWVVVTNGGIIGATR